MPYSKPLTTHQNWRSPSHVLYEQLFASQEGQCFYRRKVMHIPPKHRYGPQHADRIILEHLYPKVLRDKRKTLNQYIVGACYACNSERGSAYHWRDFMIMKIEQLWAPQ